jgi:hypothetical protein
MNIVFRNHRIKKRAAWKEFQPFCVRPKLALVQPDNVLARIQISPRFGSINPADVSAKLLRRRSADDGKSFTDRTSRSTPRKISCCPIFFVNERTSIIGDELPGTG